MTFVLFGILNVVYSFGSCKGGNYRSKISKLFGVFGTKFQRRFLQPINDATQQVLFMKLVKNERAFEQTFSVFFLFP